MSQKKWALVTGASGGMGAEFARLLAERGYDLVLTARRLTKLEGIAVELRGLGGKVVIEQLDLSMETSVGELMDRLAAQNITLNVLINNAGQGLYGDFIDQDLAEIHRMMQLNVISLTALTHRVANDMARRGSGHILLVSSLTSFMPCPTYAAYAATKAYVRHFGDALHAELASRKVVVSVLSPGLMDTGFLSASGQQASPAMRRTMTSPRLAAEVGLNALFSRRQSVVAGALNKVVALVSRLLPRSIQTRVMRNALNS